ncbi:HAD family hydrolase [Candidatus Micrarchaeota archaeon]|nr:HAD family hydrolase [Candidatus Micrarchaeota archaeon]
MKAIVFDVDSTLCYLQTDYDSLRADLKKRFGKEFKPLFPTIRNLSPADSARALKMVDVAEIEGAKKAEAVEGVAEALPEFAEKYDLAAYSSNCTRAILAALQELRWSEYFDFVIGRNSTADVKPNPRFLRTISESLCCPPKDMLVVGDHEVENESARSVGAGCALVATGNRSLEQLSALKPSHGAFASFKEFSVKFIP